MLVNKDRAYSYMSKFRLKALIGASRVNVAYLSGGFDCWLYRNYWENLLVVGAPRQLKEQYAVLPVDQNPLLVIDSYTSLYASELEDLGGLRCYGNTMPEIKQSSRKDRKLPHLSFFDDAISNQESTPGEALIRALKEAGADRGRVGIELSAFRESTLRQVRKALPDVTFLDCQELLALIRMVKTSDEKDKLVRAAKINEKALHKSLEEAQEDVKISKLVKSFLIEISKEGAMFDHYFYCPNGLYLSAAPNYRLCRGEYTMIDSGCTYDLYYGDMATTILVGQKNREIEKRYRDVWETIDEVADSLRPGTLPTSIIEKFAQLFEKRGLQHVDYQGHGIGLEPREFPVMLQGSSKTISDGIVKMSTEIPLEMGMVISLEGSMYEFGEGSFEIERTFVLEERSAKEVTSRKKNRSIFTSA